MEDENVNLEDFINQALEDGLVVDAVTNKPVKKK